MSSPKVKIAHGGHRLAATAFTFLALGSFLEAIKEETRTYLVSVQSCADAHIRNIKFSRLTP
jgi:hypothetical protein